jgi:hypothetical protein
MSKAMTGKAGQTVSEQVQRKVIACFWDRGRAHWGQEIEFGILASGFKDGSKVKISLFEKDDHQKEHPVKTFDVTTDRGRAKTKWKIDYKDPDQTSGDVYEFFFIADVENGAVVSKKDQCPILMCDLDHPGFSE